MSARDRLKGYLEKIFIFILLVPSLGCPNAAISSTTGTAGRNQSLEIGASYLNLQKSFLDFPIRWKGSMPMIAARYGIITGEFRHRIGFHCGRSTYIEVNGSKRWGNNNFSIFGFSYDFIWYSLSDKEGQKFFWGLGASLRNMQIDQKTEISPGKYNKYEDHYFGIGPVVSLFWRLGRSELGSDLGSVLSVPRTSFGILRSDMGFTDKSLLWWFDVETHLYYEFAVSTRYHLVIRLNRSVLVYGRTVRNSPKMDNFYSGGSVIFKSVEMSLNHNF